MKNNKNDICRIAFSSNQNFPLPSCLDLGIRTKLLFSPFGIILVPNPIWYWVRRGVTLLNQMTVLSTTLRPFTTNFRIFKHFSNKFHIFHLARSLSAPFSVIFLQISNFSIKFQFINNFPIFSTIFRTVFELFSALFRRKTNFPNRFRTVFGAFSSKN